MAAQNAPKPNRRRRNKPVRGDYTPSPGIGWQHGPLPEPPEGLMPASTAAWGVWMRAWFAANWSPDDLPGLRKVILLYDATERGELQRSAELRMAMDTYGITPKGQQDRRWVRPTGEEPAAKAADEPKPSRYAHLRAVG